MLGLGILELDPLADFDRSSVKVYRLRAFDWPVRVRAVDWDDAIPFGDWTDKKQLERNPFKPS